MNTMTHEMQVAFPGKARRFYPGRTGPEVCPHRLRLNNVIRQLVPSSRPLREMRGECFAGFFNRFDECAAEFFILEMPAHDIDKSLPELPATFFMNSLVAYHGKLMCSGRDENEHRIALTRFVHAKPMKFLLRSNYEDTGLEKVAREAGRRPVHQSDPARELARQVDLPPTCDSGLVPD